MSCRIIITEWASPQRHGACETEKITESERSSTDCAGVHSHSVSIAAGSSRGSLLALLVLVREDHFITVAAENGQDGTVNRNLR